MDKIYQKYLYWFLIGVVGVYIAFYIGYTCTKNDWFYWPTCILSGGIGITFALGGITCAIDEAERRAKSAGRRNY